MSTLNTEPASIKRSGPRNPAQKGSELSRNKKKPMASHRSISAGNNQKSISAKTRTGVSGNASSAQSESSHGSSQTQRLGQSKRGDRAPRKSNVSRTPRNQKSGNSRGAAAKNGAPLSDIPDLETGPETDEQYASKMSQTRHMPKLSTDPVISYTPEELAAAGPLFSDPNVYGFMAPQQRAKPRPMPRYMLVQPRLLAAPPFKQTPWDKANQEKMLEMEKANTGSDYSGIYEEFQKMRETERAKMEELGLVDAENITKDLNDAIFFQGTCLDMCPTFERIRRSLENNVKALEKDPATHKISRSRAVKAFSRPAAGQPPPMPSDVRPPSVLVKTLDYIVDSILPQLPDSHSFIWDRTRSIRQDFVYQNFYGPEAIDCNERIVRIHLLSLHVMAGSEVEYSQQQELEQFNKALQTLTESYQDVRNHGGMCPNEPEFRAYHLLSHFRDPELEREVQTLPDRVFRSPEVQLALRFRTIMSQSNVVERGYVNKIGAVNLFVEFFKLVFAESTPLLLACLLETHFNEIRFYALKSMSRSYHTKAKAFSAESLRQMLGFDTISKVEEFLTYYEIDTFEEGGEMFVDLCNKQKLESKYKLNSLSDKPKRAPAYSPQLDYRFRGHSLSSFVNSGVSNADLHIDQSKIDEVFKKIHSSQNAKKKAVSANFIGSANSKSAATPFQPRQSQTTQPAFGQSTPTPSAFEKPTDFAAKPQAQSASFNISEFLKNKNSSSGFSQTGSGQTPTVPAFDFTAKKSDAPPFTASPALFKQNSTSQGSENRPGQVTKASEKSSAKLTPLFDASSSNKPVLVPEGSTKSQAPAKTPFDFGTNKLELKEKENSEPKNKAPENKNVFIFGGSGASKEPAPPKTIPPHFNIKPAQKSPEVTAKAPMKAEARYLKNNANFPNALEQVFGSILDKTVQSELKEIVRNKLQQHNRTSERNKVITLIAEELYSAFLAEQSYHAIMESVADAFYGKNLKRSAILKLQKASRRSREKQNERVQREKEVESVSFRVPALKRKHTSSSPDTSITKRRMSFSESRSNITLQDMNERQIQLQQLWQPIDLDKFVSLCARNTKAKSQAERVSLSCIIIAENWSLPYSKWLSTKFSMKASDNKTHYVNEVVSESLAVVFRSLPKSDFINERSFHNAPFLVFECGLLDDQQVKTHKTLAQKLMRDGKILSKIIQLFDRFSYYKVQVLILIWDVTCCGMPGDQKSDLLGISELSGRGNCIQDVRVCDMSGDSANVPQDLENSLFGMGQSFCGHLSKRGLQKRAALQSNAQTEASKKETVISTAEESETAATTLRAKEAEILKKAKDLQKRRYLTAHITANRSGDLTNVSNAGRMPHGSFANHTLMNYNSTILGNNTFLHARDASFMKSFANASVIEESTPMGSPGPKMRDDAKNSTLPLPKKVQELKDITASIRAKYKK